MNYWLLKSEPSTFSIDDLRESPRRQTCWDGVRNYQARNFMRDGMKKGDLAFFYHSSCAEPGIAGIVRVVSKAYPDDTAFDPTDKHYDEASTPENPRWFMVDVRLERVLNSPVTLRELKQYKDSKLKDFALLRRGNRLSIMPVDPSHWDFILELEQASDSK
jgi:predicted RNA-binding protein with PUA-like domain